MDLGTILHRGDTRGIIVEAKGPKVKIQWEGPSRPTWLSLSAAVSLKQGGRVFMDWRTEEPEYFRFLHRVFDIRTAKRILAAHPRWPDELVLEKCLSLKGRMGVRPDKLDDPRIDLSVPVIVALGKDFCLPIDGWHRIEKAFKRGIEVLPCVTLDPKEVQAIQEP